MKKKKCIGNLKREKRKVFARFSIFVSLILFSIGACSLEANAAAYYLAENANISDYAVSFSVASGGTSEAYFEFDYPPRPETFVIKLTDAAKIQHARDILSGKIRDTVHIIGNIIKEPASYNNPWSYYLNPDSISFFASATEVCDAGIQYVEDNLSEVGGSFLPGNSWCPWGSRLVKEVNNPIFPPDTTPPTVSITSPRDGVTVSGTITVSASASDNVGVTGVQFQVDGVNLGAEDTISPYETTLDTTTLTNGAHTLSVIAKDAAGNSATSSAVTIKVDTQPPTTPTNLQATAISSSQINLSWSASTDNVRVTGYKIYRDGAYVAAARQGTTYSDTGLTPSTTYTYTVSAYDAAENESEQSNAAIANTLPPSDFTPPTVSVTFPVNNLAVAGSIPVSATASDNVGVSGVQFKLDGANLGSEDTLAPYSTSWDTTQFPDGSYTLTAVARDAEGNTTASLAIIVMTDNIDNNGDYYDNRDGNHARLNLSTYPNVTYISSGYGAQWGIVADKVVVGNSSTAIVSGEMWGSNVRVSFMRNQYGANAGYSQYTNNNGYWYPEHRDHDETDYYFTQTPTVNSSQGSSGTELDEVGKWFRALAAFKPEVREFLKTNGLLIPTIQMIARRTRVTSDEEYLNGRAHPNAFDNLDNRTQIEEMASAMEVGNVPPMVKIAVVEDGFISKPSEDFFEFGIDSEKIYDTPASIARAFRGREYTKRIVVSAADSFDVNNRPLTFQWKTLRGDPAHIQINLLNQDGSQAEILVGYHPQTVIEGSTRNTNLVSVGVFAHNGVYYSAPAFVTSYTLNNEVREYDPETKRLIGISYNSNYVDPSLTTAKSWESDTYQYDEQGTFRGWRRTNVGQIDEFTKEGYLVVEKNLDGRITKASLVSYSKDTITKKIVWQPTGEPFDYNDDFLPPTIPTGLTVQAVSSNQINFSWAASTDNVGVAGYKIYRDGTLVISLQSPVTSYSDTGLQPSTTYAYTVSAYDAAGNESAQSTPVSATTLNPPDITPPEVSITSPLSGAVVSGTILIQASATDNVGVAGVQFLLDGANLQAEDTSSPYSISLDTTTIPNGTHTISAQTRDSSENMAIATDVLVTVLNGVDNTPPVISAVLSSWITANSATITWTTDEPATSQAEYGTSRNYGKLTPIDSSLVTIHRLQLKGLTPGTLYHYRVRSKDAVGNEAVSKNFYFTTKRALDIPPQKDTTPPTVPIVIDGGQFTSDRYYLSASWSSNDAESGIVEYRYKITKDSPTNGTIIRAWKSAGKNTSVTVKWVNLQWGKTYYFSVMAKNGVGLWSQVGHSDGITARK